MRIVLPLCAMLLVLPSVHAEEGKAASKGIAYLVTAQKADGSFAPNQFGRSYKRGITGLGVLALLNRGEKASLAAARKGLGFLKTKARPRQMYSHGYAALALCEGAIKWKDDYRAAAAAAVKLIVDNQHANGGWGYQASPRSSRTEACMAAIMIHALMSGRAAGIKVPQGTIDKAKAFLHKRYDAGRKMFDNETYRSPSYGGTAMALAALGQLRERDTDRVKGALSYLDGREVAKLTANLKGRPFSGYMRGAFHFELTAHGVALYHAAESKRLDAWLERVRKRVAQQQAEDGSWDGWFGKAYGTSLMCLLLELDRQPKLAWFERSAPAGKK